MQTMTECRFVWLVALLSVTLLFPDGSDAIFKVDRKIMVSKFHGKHRTITTVHAAKHKWTNATLAAIHSLSAEVKSDLLQAAEWTLAHKQYPQRTATGFLEFSRTGNRPHYEGNMTAHRLRLGQLVIGHLLDRERNQTADRFLPEVVNGVWHMLETSVWCWPAHIYQQHTPDKLPTPGHVSLDLGAGEEAKFLAWTRVLLATEFDRVSPVINARISAELRKRIFDPYIENTYDWQGFGHDHKVNNWAAWMNANILRVAILTLDDSALFNAVLNRSLYTVDYFLDSYGDDGGCDEGPSYWRHAGGRLVEYLEAIEAIAPEAKQYFQSLPLLTEIGRYSYKMLIEHDWFVNFADADPKLTYPPAVLFKYGQLFEDESMRHFAGYMWARLNHTTAVANGQADLNEWLNLVRARAEIEPQQTSIPPGQALVWFPDLQVVNGRSSTTEPGRIFVAAKAGHNAENHNHNDVGSFVMFQNGRPVLIDIGVGTYTDRTFGAHRYENYYMQSAYHNCPDINGVQQSAGVQFVSRNVTFAELPNAGGFRFSADISGAYDSEKTHAKHWRRTIEFNRTNGGSVLVEDQYELSRWVAPQALHFVTTEAMTVTRNEHGLRLTSAVDSIDIQMTVDWSVWTLSEEIRSMEHDRRLTKVWGQTVRRLTLTTVPTFQQLSGHFSVKFTPVK